MDTKDIKKIITNFAVYFTFYIIIIIFSQISYAQTVNTSSISGTFIGGQNLAVVFTASGSFGASNTFFAQLSGSSGSFANSVIIGYLAGTVSGTINALIPAGIAQGSGYRVRVVSTSPVVTGSNNGSNLYIIPIFSDINAGLTGVYLSSVAWGDYNNDGYLDILITGEDSSGNRIATIYRNNNGTFTDINAGLTGVHYSSAAWGDFNNDGYTDLLITGENSSGNRISRIYRNDNGTFTNINAGLDGVWYSSVAWGDYNNDGDIDILISGADNSGNVISRIYRNNNGTFTNINAGLKRVYSGSAAFCDYDSDGDMDILITGQDNSGNAISKIYRNDNGIFTDINAGLTGVYTGSVAWGDYNNDGSPDILITGMDSAGNNIAKIYRNDNGSFTDINAGLAGVSFGSVAWGDYNNDGNLDILITGEDNSGNPITKIYRNDNGTFTDINAGLPGVYVSSVAFGDYNNDGKLDILITGWDNSGNKIAKIYRNNTALSNTAPGIPSNLSVQTTGLSTYFSWNRSTDMQTAQNALSYNLRIGTSPGGVQIMSPMSSTVNGVRRVASMGNTCLNNHWTINNLPNGIYYWSVQAIDNGFAGSGFSPEQSFTITSNTYTSNTYNSFTYSSSTVSSKEINIIIALQGAFNGTIQTPVPVSIELRSGANLISSTLTIRKYGMLDQSGSISQTFSEVPDGNYWLLVRSGGWLPLASSYMIALPSAGLNYNFSVSSASAVGGDRAMIYINNIWQARAGDFDGSRSITPGDATNVLGNVGRSLSGEVPGP